ncbi:hypothetical protein E3N88_23090 [Mikania micrantha]|uniref:Uncharacterized protein n=1 Tax=Mikania micrantha TaxID=192012 RepID=A0A5N6NDE8_9ASTR|nr:hypothetical protein E3N88_23090 [Mikania micrantha]
MHYATTSPTDQRRQRVGGSNNTSFLQANHIRLFSSSTRQQPVKGLRAHATVWLFPKSNHRDTKYRVLTETLKGEKGLVWQQARAQATVRLFPTNQPLNTELKGQRIYRFILSPRLLQKHRLVFFILVTFEIDTLVG